jgi:asparagine synthase (glutamine-hydrolysing)
MCGIGGWLGNLPSDERVAKNMAQAMFHRGPDAHGIRSWPEATLVHTRLSIIDLSPAGSQPMANEDQTVWTVFNGEIYNHRQLRHHLEADGHVFKGRSDTEVIPHLYEEKGLAFVEQLRGMFALAIYDTRTRTLVLARDRFGIKPLFYAPGRHFLAFASEIRALRELPEIDDRPDRQAVYDYSALFHIPAPQTFFAGIRALQPGEMLIARLEEPGPCWKTHTYHRWSIAPDPSMTLRQAAEQADELITDAVCRQIESDVPLGALLSGGIDSSLVSVAAQSALSGGLQTFNVRFSEKQYDETWAALTVSTQIGSHHETLEMDGVRGTWDYVTNLLQHAGQPYADSSLFAANAVSRSMRRHVTVALSGDGGDEGFGGYDFYWWIAWLARWQTLPRPLRSGALALLKPLSGMRLIPTRSPQRLMDLDDDDDTTMVQNLFCWLRGQEHRRLWGDTNLLPVRRLFEAQWAHHLPPRASRLERLSMLTTEANVRLLLASDYLFKVDMASMKESLEVRVPMLDEELFAFGLTIPHQLKVDGTTCKRVLRRVAERKLPQAIARKPKFGFRVPVDAWIDAEFKTNLRDALLGSSSRLPEFFRPEAYRPIVESFCDGSPYPATSRQGLYERAIMFLAVHLALNDFTSLQADM